MKTVAIIPLAACALLATACGDKNPRSADARETTTVPRQGNAIAVSELSAPERGRPAALGLVTYEQAESAYTERRFAEAVALFNAYTETRAENPWGHYMLGLALWKSGDRPGAETAFRRALERDSTLVKASLNLARVLLEQNKPAEARVTLDDVLAFDSTLAEAHRLVGRLHEVEGDPSAATEAYLFAVTLDSAEVWSMNNLGVLLIEQGRYEEALPPLARAVELRPGAPVFQNNLGIALERSGHFTAAAAAYSAALAADSTYPKSRVNLERVSQLTQAITVTPLDLRELARQFVRQAEDWRARQGANTEP